MNAFKSEPVGSRPKARYRTASLQARISGAANRMTHTTRDRSQGGSSSTFTFSRESTGEWFPEDSTSGIAAVKLSSSDESLFLIVSLSWVASFCSRLARGRRLMESGRLRAYDRASARNSWRDAAGAGRVDQTGSRHRTGRSDLPALDERSGRRPPPTALAFPATIDQPERFGKSGEVGAHPGLTRDCVNPAKQTFRGASADAATNRRARLFSRRRIPFWFVARGGRPRAPRAWRSPSFAAQREPGSRPPASSRPSFIGCGSTASNSTSEKKAPPPLAPRS